MAFNFRLSYNQGFSYVDLFPRTDIEAITFNTSTSRHASINVTIPTSSDLVQTIAIDTPANYLNVPVYMELLYKQESDIYNYSTISQFQIIDGALEITRLYNKPTGEIQVVLIFNINDNNLLKYSTLPVVIPPSDETIQSITITPTRLQMMSPFYMELISTGTQAELDYAKILQVQVTENALVVTRLGGSQLESLNVNLLFKEGGFNVN